MPNYLDRRVCFDSFMLESGLSLHQFSWRPRVDPSAMLKLNHLYFFPFFYDINVCAKRFHFLVFHNLFLLFLVQIGWIEQSS